MWKNRHNQYALSIIVMHWCTVVLIVLTYGFTLASAQAFEGSAFRETLQGWHYLTGMLVLPLVGIRLLLRAVGGPAPRITPSIDPWLRVGSRVLHGILIALLIALPLLGWLTLSAEGQSIPFDLPAIWAQDPTQTAQFKRWHVWIGEAGYYLIGIHAVATLGHHYILNDDTFLRMVPRRWFGADYPRDDADDTSS